MIKCLGNLQFVIPVDISGISYDNDTTTSSENWAEYKFMPSEWSDE